jgi:spermidine/putrescine-binding protein
MTFMDHVYDPNVQALIEAYNAYVCPVPSAKPLIAKAGYPEVANSPTVFPDEQQVAVSKPYFQFTTAEELDQWNNTFQPIYT